MLKIEPLISRILRTGVLIVGALLGVSWLWLLAKNGSRLQNFSVYEPQSLVESLHWALVMNDTATLMAFSGLFLLVTLPILRVLLTGILFAKQKEGLLAGLAFLVFVALLGSLFLGLEI